MSLLSATANPSCTPLRATTPSRTRSIVKPHRRGRPSSCPQGILVPTPPIRIDRTLPTNQRELPSLEPLVTAVGGTDFSDAYDQGEGGPKQTAYWSTKNSALYGNALGYIPETVWNEGCASSLIATYLGYTGAGDCGSASANPPVANSIVGGGGGFSTHYAQPSYQAGIPGLDPSATKRAYPDVSLFASSGVWGHYLISATRRLPALRNRISAPPAVLLSPHLRSPVSLRWSWRREEHASVASIPSSTVSPRRSTPPPQQPPALLLEWSDCQHRSDHRATSLFLHLQRCDHQQQRRLLRSRCQGLLCQPQCSSRYSFHQWCSLARRGLSRRRGI